jgi:hypothetical protein
MDFDSYEYGKTLLESTAEFDYFPVGSVFTFKAYSKEKDAFFVTHWGTFPSSDWVPASVLKLKEPV